YTVHRSARLTLCYHFFFFSSRRRHTRSKRDWSSDVCSSDLDPRLPPARPELGAGVDHGCSPAAEQTRQGQQEEQQLRPQPSFYKIGRASCRERVEISEAEGAVKEKECKTESKDWGRETICAA